MDPIWDEQGAHVGFAKVTRDLSERREAEEALRRSEERFRLLVQGVTDYAIYMLDPEGHVSSWNAGAERFKGYTADEIIGLHFSRFYTEEDRAAQIPRNALTTAAREGRFDTEGWRVRKDGGRFWASVVIDRIIDGGGKLLGFTKITRDLTERKQAQEALDASREQFFQAQKMEAVGQLTGGVAHDFNNILAAIISSLRIAQRRQASGEDGTSFVDNAIMAAERGATLTQRMLAFARKQELQLAPVDLMASVREMADLLQRTIGAMISIRLDFPLELPAVVADKTQIELAILNLVVNARDAMPAGGVITVSGHIDRTEPERGVCLTIEDQGEGMNSATLNRAVEPFFTTKGVGKGTGLGLSMVKGMVEQCGGRLILSSVEGEGTKAQIRLKVADKAAQAQMQVSDEVIAAGEPLRILAVDDDPLILLNTVTILEDLGHSVLEASSGKAALDILDAEAVDLLITDFAMPNMTGAELVRRAKVRHPALKVILASGYADLAELEDLDLPRLSKPYSEQELAAALAASA